MTGGSVELQIVDSEYPQSKLVIKSCKNYSIFFYLLKIKFSPLQTILKRNWVIVFAKMNHLNTFSTILTKWSNLLKQFVRNLPTISSGWHLKGKGNRKWDNVFKNGPSSREPFQKIEVIWSVLTDHITSNFLKADFHKFDLFHS